MGFGMEELLFEEFVVDDINIVLDVIPEEIYVDNSMKLLNKEKKKKITRNYINNVDFYDALVDYKNKCESAAEVGFKRPMISNYIGECFNKLADGLAKRPNFFGYSYRDEMVCDGVENCLRYIDRFNPEKTKNPFAYFTQILWWAFVRRIKKEKLQQYIKYKATENFGALDSSDLMELGDNHVKQLEVYENMYEYIQKFEETLIKKTKNNVKIKQQKICGIELFLED